jgi:localization factor PodJL
MSHMMPRNAKSSDLRTNDAVRKAAQRAGMSVNEWLDMVTRDAPFEISDESAFDEEPDTSELDAIAARLSRLSRNRSQTAPIQPASSSVSRDDIKTLIAQTAENDRRARDANTRTTEALDSIAKWIESTEVRLAASTQNQSAPGHFDIDRQRHEPVARYAQAARPSLSRAGLGAAVADIRSRQRMLDEPQAANDRVSENRISGLRGELETLSQTVNALAQSRPAQRPPEMERRRASDAFIDSALRDIASKLENRQPDFQAESLTRALARIETEVSKLAQNKPAPVQKSGQDSEIARAIVALSSKIDQLGQQGSSRHELEEIRALIAAQRPSGASEGMGNIEGLGQQLSILSGEISRMREQQVDGRELTDIRDAVDDVRSGLRSAGGNNDLARQIEALSARLDQLPGITAAEIDDRIGTLSRKLETLSVQANTHDIDLHRRLEGLIIKLEDAADRDQAPGGEIEQRLINLQSRIDELHVQDMKPVERQYEALSARIEQLAASASMTQLASTTGKQGKQAPAPDLKPIERQYEALSAQIEQLVSGRDEYLIQASLPDLKPIERQYEALSAQIQLLASGRGEPLIQASAPDLKPIEDMLRQLSGRLDEVQRPDAGPDAISALEHQIATLANRLDIAQQRSGHEIETRLQDIVSHLSSLRESAGQQAEHVARTVMGDTLAGMQHSQSDLDDKTQKALGAVHESLERIVSRLATLEQDIVSERVQPAKIAMAPAKHPSFEAAVFEAAIPAQQAVPVREDLARAMSKAVAPAADMVASHNPAPRDMMPPVRSAPVADGLLDLPLEPGSGRPGGGRMDASQAFDQDGLPANEPGQVKASFIAAARRAAKAAVEAQAQNEKTEAPKSRTAFNPSKLKGAFAKPRKQVVLLSLAALILAVGAMHVLSTPPGTGTPTLEDPAAARQSRVIEQGNGATTGDKVSSLPGKTTGDAASRTAASTSQALPKADLPKTDPLETASAGNRVPAELPSAKASDIANGAGSAFGASPALAAPVTTPQAAQPVSAAPNPAITVASLPELPTTGLSAGLRKAALGGDALAVYEIANRLIEGKGVQRDPKLALRMFERAAAAGLIPAQFRVGNMYEKAMGTSRDVGLARSWYERAAEKGNAKAMHNLAVLYAEGATGRPDYAEAVNWFKKASELGVRDSQFNLAVLMARGLGTSQDMVQSYIWFAVAAREGDDDAGKKRDEVAAQLKSTDLATARAAVNAWKAKPADAGVNEISGGTQAWDESPAAPKKPAKNSRG